MPILCNTSSLRSQRPSTYLLALILLFSRWAASQITTQSLAKTFDSGFLGAVLEPQTKHRARIQCDGTIPPSAEWYGAKTMTKLCASSDIGGMPNSLGAFCAWNEKEPRIYFEEELNSRTSAEHTSLYLICLSRCKAVNGPTLTNFKVNSPIGYCKVDKDGSTSRAMVWYPVEQGMQTTRLYLETRAIAHHKVGRFVDEVLAIPMAVGLRTYQPTRYIKSAPRLVTPIGGLRPACVGNVPPWLPPPYNLLGYKKLSEVCMSRRHGGHRLGSAGLVCTGARQASPAPLVPPPGQRPFLPMAQTYFDEWTPYLLSAANYPIGVALRAYCTVNCHCDDASAEEASRNPITVRQIPWLGPNFQADITGGGVKLKSTSTTKGGVVTLVSEADGKGAAVKAKQHPDSEEMDAEAGRVFVQEALERGQSIAKSGISLRQQRYRGLVNADTSRLTTINVLPGPESEAVCGATCLSNRDCDGDCACLASSRNLPMETLGQTLFAGAVCAIVERAKWRGGLVRRVVGRESACACNETYVSVGCCGSRDGLVWEDAQYKLGTLA